MSKDVQLIALAVKGNAISCRILGKDHVLTLRPSGAWETMPGEIVTVSPRQEVALWRPSLPRRRDQGLSHGHTRSWPYTPEAA